MTLESMLRDYAAFNLWANTQFVEWLKTKPLELLEREMASSYPSIRETLLHIWGAQEVWLERLNGISPGVFLTQRFSGNMPDIFEGMLQQSRQFDAYVQALPDADFQEICDFKLFNGTEDRRPRAQMIHHCLNHSTYHRGQLVTMGRNVGLTDPPSTDFIKYIRLSAETELLDH